jgi:hypothetical protein
MRAATDLFIISRDLIIFTPAKYISVKHRYIKAGLKLPVPEAAAKPLKNITAQNININKSKISKLKVLLPLASFKK